MSITIEEVTAKEKVLKLAPSWSEEQAAAALRAVESEAALIVVEDKRPTGTPPTVEEWGAPEMLPVPKSWGWGRLPSGRPAPNWVAGLDAVRCGR